MSIYIMGFPLKKKEKKEKKTVYNGVVAKA